MEIRVERFIKHLKIEINKQGSCRKKFSNMLYDWFDYNNKNKHLLSWLNQRLKEERIIVYTKKQNVKNQAENWDWFDLKSNDIFVTFVYNKKNIRSKINGQNIIKMNVYNEPIPTEKLFTQFAVKAKEILICSAYVDEEMSALLASIAKKNNTIIRFVADHNFNSNFYRRPIIRAKLETVGTFRTMSGLNDD